MKTAIHPFGKQITFTDQNHLYQDSDGYHYTSVTSLVKKAFPKFDAESAAKRIATRDGISETDVLMKWAETRTAACVYGTRCHETAEALLLDRPVPHQPKDEKERTAFSLIWDSVRTLRSTWQLLAVEQIVFSPRLGIAGTVDLIMLDPAGTLWILDWKTNKQIDFQNRFNQYGLWPIQHVQDCNYAHYTLQLSVYETIIRDDGYLNNLAVKKIERALLYVPPGSTQLQFIPVPFQQLEVWGIFVRHFTADVPF